MVKTIPITRILHINVFSLQNSFLFNVPCYFHYSAQYPYLYYSGQNFSVLICMSRKSERGKVSKLLFLANDLNISHASFEKYPFHVFTRNMLQQSHNLMSFRSYENFKFVFQFNTIKSKYTLK